VLGLVVGFAARSTLANFVAGVMIAGAGVWASGTPWPDIAVAAIVALSVALGLPGTHYTRIAASLHDPIVQAAAVLARTRQPDLARAFLAYANGPAARPILTAYGFAPTETR